MKYFMVIDGAINSTYEVYGVDEAIFGTIFPEDNDVAFIDEVETRFRVLGKSEIDIYDALYSMPVDKKSIHGLHGILHLTGSNCQKEYFPNRKESDVFNKRDGS